MRVVGNDRSQSRAFAVIRCYPVEVCLADRYRGRPTAQIGGVQRGDRRLLDRERRGARGHDSPHVAIARGTYFRRFIPQRLGKGRTSEFDRGRESDRFRRSGDKGPAGRERSGIHPERSLDMPLGIRCRPPSCRPIHSRSFSGARPAQLQDIAGISLSALGQVSATSPLIQINDPR